MSRHDASDLAQRLRRQAEAVCRHYLSSGRREGRYWLVGDVRNTPGRSMYVRLKDSPKGPAGKWTDAATGEHGDLLDVIRDSCGLIDFKDVADEARTFLSMPQPEPAPAHPRQAPAPHGSPEAARRLFGVALEPLGALHHCDTLARAVRARLPVIPENLGVEAVTDLGRLVTRLLGLAVVRGTR